MSELAQEENKPRVCLECGEPLIKRENESEPRFLKKRFNSADCARQWLKRNNKGWWSKESKDRIFHKDG